MRILIIEDQENLVKLLKNGFEREGFAVDCLTDGESAQKRIEIHHQDYDAIVMDLMLPKKNGFDICKAIRESNIKTPILILTAKDNPEDKISLLDAGADDYLVKPFNFNELLARIRAITRRPIVMLSSTLSLGNLTINPAEKTVFINEKEISVTLTEFRLLEYFMRNPDKILEREAIASNVWDFNFDSFSNIIDVYISKLRKKIYKNSGKKIFKTVRGSGYKIIN
ncbi:MAG: hypothetical protein A2312_01035 [Candidatus Staskawiczbacteria bacterium RIFOXYB2_FULL_32_9]|uniref:DNA-binding response regulator n=1 Tax=Candidatus Staskawiczbacteria bacterium RIFOXYD1_FULL_32_13 TaxID=1802234 RepID=A0A1G2JN68_9BACT|nr:MAG: Two component transcriptional regulator, winged helix family [Parcubacteria group bacterium GW2011_GWC2_32_10]OGZ80916.1 MAG: hypothetical protein A2360_03480 [Candidatus Staskawiczbacteria bacterium RIFOXYB1_FULL_32_11]OGZ81112.1 MAG: hypothetical protein A2256_02440 [Candidatus Staskawiczbacteria bacterium RIFOXYA2_FULL_32_7]OGZ82767.1 MAG: hypothetical protein A2312_01035 [Candidatus Staskawiczbacteria bacterium RIFOXYB2_FULL_32_9]OGZ87891.1 MAG: hypothetical protein A2561_01065 [Can